MEQAILQKNIMRRVYYSFAIACLTHPLTVRVVLASVLLYVMSNFVSYQAVLSNMLNVRVGDLDTFFYSALVNTEAWTLLLGGALVFIGLSYRPAIPALSRVVSPV